MDVDRIFAGLNPEQRRAVEHVRGPVCILAGAGSGKTTTITRRIANQVVSGAFEPDQILAVTFTDKAAGEMAARLAALGASGVAARTFHSAALAQLRAFRGETPGRILASKALPLRYIGNSLPRPYRFRPAADLATEVEWAKNRRIAPRDYLRSLGDHEPPIPKDIMVRVYRDYERRKAEQGYVDFEDLIEMAIRLLDADAGALEQVRDRYRAFTVDEYQDVNLLQQTLLDRWLGKRDELCAVGDDYQSIYAFTGTSPEYLLAMPQRFPSATVVRLEDNYRSTPEVLEIANRLVPQLGGAPKVLRPTRLGGPEPVTESFTEPEHEASFIVARMQALHGQGVLETIPDKLGEREVTRQNDLARLVRLAEEFGEGTVAEFIAQLEERFGSSAGRGVHLLTYHRAKGLEFEGVFLPRLEERELPSKLSKTAVAIAEERRLLYVGLTRAKRHLTVTWAGKPSRFLAELGIEEAPRKAAEPDDPLYAELKRWRLERAKAEGRPAYVI